MTKTSDWLDGYLRAWRSKDPDDIRAIFTDDAEYLFRPDDTEPAIGIDAIIAMWDDEPVEPEIDLAVLVEDGDIGIVSGSVVYPGHNSYRNLWEVYFAPDGRARRFVEWYLSPPQREAAGGATGG